MNILFISEAALDKKNSFGNTICNLFEGEVWKNDCFFHFYTRHNPPENNLTCKYYNLSALDVIKGSIKLKIVGKQYSTKHDDKSKPLFVPDEAERKQIERIHKRPNDALYYLYELVWRSRIWLNKDCKQFLLLSDIDIVFVFANPVLIIHPIIDFLQKKTKCQVVLFVVDDIWESYKRMPWYRRGYYRKALSSIANSSALIYGISPEICNKYSELFNKHIGLLRKGCKFESPIKQDFICPLRIIYAGNLLWGRDLVLEQIISELVSINKECIFIRIDVYSNTCISQKLINYSTEYSYVGIHEAQDNDKIKKELAGSDIVLFVESFDPCNMETVRYSFSTKIIDCLESGNVPLAIGPAGITSIEYFRQIDGAFVVDDIKKIRETLLWIVKNNNSLRLNAINVRKYAIKNHSFSTVHSNLRESLISLNSNLV